MLAAVIGAPVVNPVQFQPHDIDAKFPGGYAVAVADFNTFALLQSKAAFIAVLDALHLPHPPTTICHSRAELEQLRPFPYYIKMAYGTAGSSVWRIDEDMTQAAVIELLEAKGLLNEQTDILVQAVAPCRTMLILSRETPGDAPAWRAPWLTTLRP